MSFGYSVGDIALGIKLIGTAIASLKESDGASSEYQGILRDLSDLQHILNFLQDARLQANTSNADVTLLNAVAARAQKLAQDVGIFLESIHKYGHSLGHDSDKHRHIPRKLQWGLIESKKLSTLRTNVSSQLNIINALQQSQHLYV